MKPITFFVLAVLFILTADLSYNLGRQKQRDFEALCETPGVRCAVQLAPWYVEQHPRGIEILPHLLYEFREDGGLSGSVPSPCTPGDMLVCVKHDDIWDGNVATTTPGGGQ